MSVKTFLNVLDIISLIENIKDIIIDSYINNIYSIESGITILLRKGDLKNELLIDTRGWIFILKYEIEHSPLTDFSKNLRKHIIGCKVVDLSVPYFDRFIKIVLTNGFNLYIEFMQGGNIILEKENIIIDAFKEAKYKEREIKRGKNYVLPLVHETNPLKMSVKEILSRIKESKAGIVATFLKSLGIPSEIVEEACYIANFPKEKPVREFSEDDLIKVIEIILNLVNMYLSSKEAYVYFKDNFMLTLSNIRLSSFREYNSYVKPITEAVNYYYFNIVGYIKKIEEEKKLKELEKKKEIKLKQLLDNKANIMNRINVISEYIISMNNLQSSLINFFNQLNDYLKNKDFEKLKNYIANNWYYELGEIKSIDLKDKRMVVNFKGELINLYIHFSFMKNLDELYKELKKLKKAVEELDEKIEAIRKESPPKLELPKIELKEKKGKKWFENFLWFITSNGHLCVAGKDASQNESLIKKRAGEEDLIFHADIHGSPFAILKKDNKEITEDEILEVAQFVVSYSSAWKYGFSSMNAYWVKKDQVSKKAPSGMYLAKGSFMIYGKKNFINNIPLRLAIVVSDDELRIYPFFTAQKIFKDFVTIVPGNLKKEDLIEKVVKWFLANKFKINIEEAKRFLYEALPKGSYEIIGGV